MDQNRIKWNKLYKMDLNRRKGIKTEQNGMKQNKAK